MKRFMPMAFARPYLQPRFISNKPKDWQFHIRVGEHPRIKLYVASDFQYVSSEEARHHAERECKRRGLDPMRVKVYTITKQQRKAMEDKKAA